MAVTNTVTGKMNYLTVGSNTYEIEDKNAAPLASPAFTGTPTAPTATAGTSTTQIATTEFVQNAMSGAGAGTVTSVGISNATNGGLSISGSPITSSGTITIGLDTAYGDTKNPYGAKSPHYILAGPSSGTSSAVPGFRALVADDIPALNYLEKTYSYTYNTTTYTGTSEWSTDGNTLTNYISASNGTATSSIAVSPTEVYLTSGNNQLLLTSTDLSYNNINSGAYIDFPSESGTLALTSDIIQRVWYGTCSTTASTAAKVVTCSGWDAWGGTIIGILFSTANTAATPTLNVNSKGAKNIYVGSSTPNSTDNVLKWSANTMVYFLYDGAYFRYITSVSAGSVAPSRGANTWYGTSSTTATTQAKTSTIDNFVLTKGAVVYITFSTANTYASAKITLNVNSTGAKDVYYNNAVTSSTNTLLWNAGETLTFIYSGSYWYYAGKSVNKVSQLINDSGYITSSSLPSITLNGSSTTSPSFYAPTSAGTNGYVLKSNGSGAPSWTSATLTDINVQTNVATSGNTYRLIGTSATSFPTTGVTYLSNTQVTIGTDTTTLYVGTVNFPGQIGLSVTSGGEGFYTIIKSAATAGRTITLPNATGTVALTSDIPTITLNGSSTTSPSFYAPTSAGTDGYYLKSNGSGAPTWAAVPASGLATSYSNGQTNGIATWTTYGGVDLLGFSISNSSTSSSITLISGNIEINSNNKRIIVDDTTGITYGNSETNATVTLPIPTLGTDTVALVSQVPTIQLVRW